MNVKAISIKNIPINTIVGLWPDSINKYMQYIAAGKTTTVAHIIINILKYTFIDLSVYKCELVSMLFIDKRCISCFATSLG